MTAPRIIRQAFLDGASIGGLLKQHPTLTREQVEDAIRSGPLSAAHIRQAFLAGWSINRLLQEHPTLTREEVEDALRHVSWLTPPTLNDAVEARLTLEEHEGLSAPFTVWELETMRMACQVRALYGLVWLLGGAS